MTQMLLFDSSTLATNRTSATVVSSEVAANSTSPHPQNIAAAIEHQSGMHHMGDLARLVLLRYDLVAKRRAAMAARRAERSAK